MKHRPDKSKRAGRFDIERDGAGVGYLSYSVDGKVMSIHYVEVDPAFRGRKMGERLVETALDWGRSNSYDVVPICGYARAVMKRMK